MPLSPPTTTALLPGPVPVTRAAAPLARRARPATGRPPGGDAPTGTLATRGAE